MQIMLTLPVARGHQIISGDNLVHHVLSSSEVRPATPAFEVLLDLGITDRILPLVDAIIAVFPHPIVVDEFDPGDADLPGGNQRIMVGPSGPDPGHVTCRSPHTKRDPPYSASCSSR